LGKLRLQCWEPFQLLQHDTKITHEISYSNSVSHRAKLQISIFC
jgi:hypothetical protein